MCAKASQYNFDARSAGLGLGFTVQESDLDLCVGTRATQAVGRAATSPPPLNKLGQARSG